MKNLILAGFLGLSLAGCGGNDGGGGGVSPDSGTFKVMGKSMCKNGPCFTGEVTVEDVNKAEARKADLRIGIAILER